MEKKINYASKTLVSQEEINQEELNFCVEEARQQYLADKLQLQKDISSKRKEINDAKIAYPFSATLVVQSEIELMSLEKGLELMLAIGEDNNWE